MFIIKTSQRLYLRWHSSLTSLKSLPVKGAEDLKNKQQDSTKSNSANNLGF